MGTLELTEAVRAFAKHRHEYVNHQYGGKPYWFHLQMAYDFYEKFKHLIDEDVHDVVGAACWGHDLIEDTRVTYSDLKGQFGEDFAELVFLCTDYRGRTRKERKPDAYYNDLRENRLAVFVKLCDVCANFTFSAMNRKGMYEKYKKELPHVKSKLYEKNEYEEIWDYLESL